MFDWPEHSQTSPTITSFASCGALLGPADLIDVGPACCAQARARHRPSGRRIGGCSLCLPPKLTVSRSPGVPPCRQTDRLVALDHGMIAELRIDGRGCAGAGREQRAKGSERTSGHATPGTSTRNWNRSPISGCSAISSGAEHLARGGGESVAQIVAAERDLGDVGDRKAHALDQLAVGRIAARFPAGVEADPDAAFAVDGRAVGIAVFRIDPHERPPLAERARRPRIVGRRRSCPRAYRRNRASGHPARRRAVGDRDVRQLPVRISLPPAKQ